MEGKRKQKNLANPLTSISTYPEQRVTREKVFYVGLVKFYVGAGKISTNQLLSATKLVLFT